MLQILDCAHQGRQCEWSTTQEVGDFDGWGHGAMVMRVCSHCQTREYAKFKSDKGTVVDIDKMLKRGEHKSE